MVCPDCMGNKQTFGIACGPAGCKIGAMKCNRCKGNGTVPDHMKIWIEEGKKIREYRLTKNLSLREYAKTMEISPIDLSKAENGYVNPFDVVGAPEE